MQAHCLRVSRRRVVVRSDNIRADIGPRTAATAATAATAGERGAMGGGYDGEGSAHLISSERGAMMEIPPPDETA